MQTPHIPAIWLLRLAAAMVVPACNGCQSAPVSAPASTGDEFGSVVPATVDPELVERAASVPRSDVTAVASAGTRFAFALLEESASETNTLISPHSIRIALSMAMAGARGETLEELRRGLMTELSEDGRHPGLFALDVAIRHSAASGDDPYELRVANSAWLDSGLVVHQPYIDQLSLFYDAPPQSVAIGTGSGASAMNQWASENTNGLIPIIVPPEGLPSNTRLVLMNAVYFKARWEQEFDPSNTGPAVFNRVDADPLEVPSMRQLKFLRHGSADGWSAVELLYRGGAASMIVLLRDGGPTLEVPTAEIYESVLSSMQTVEVSLVLPKFRFDYATELVPALQALGIHAAFSTGADFSGISETPMHIGKVLHRTFVDVSEQGTEAAAVTAVVMDDSESIEEPPIPFIVDRPFVSVIRDTATGAILFVGQITDPSAAE
ncbi:MAG: serpin B [Bradymonadia bacterium]|jgi:serpin B